MKELIQNSSRVLAMLGIVAATVLLMALSGGYWLTQFVDELGLASQQQADQLLEMDEGIDGAAIALGHQTQEWKDMLLRVDDAVLYNKHQKAFIDASVEVQRELLRAEASMQHLGINTGDVALLRVEHQALLSYYQLAQTMLDSRHPQSFREVDRQVLGVDRNLQQHISRLKDNIERQTKQQLARLGALGAMQINGRHYLLFGLMGVVLLGMTLAGFVLAYRLQRQAIKMAARLSIA
ncbi:MAG: hypothetical protein HY306_02355 [Nitrosomonadales bacterium]|nr:hypothetical protein [Nitrosomonadales bacterium]